jgi:hypothetical protein
MAWIWSRKKDYSIKIRQVNEPKRRETDSMDYRIKELNLEIDQLRERVMYER